MLCSDTDPSVDWVVRHGRSCALSLAVKEAADKLDAPEWKDRVLTALVIYTQADRVECFRYFCNVRFERGGVNIDQCQRINF